MSANNDTMLKLNHYYRYYLLLHHLLLAVMEVVVAAVADADMAEDTDKLNKENTNPKVMENSALSRPPSI